jgi:hypothetical protein
MLENAEVAIDVAHSVAKWRSITFPQAKEQFEHMYREVCFVLFYLTFVFVVWCLTLRKLCTIVP